MTTAKVRQLYNFVPGFKNDKDEVWACYLPIKDQQFLRKSRKQYLILMDNLDGLKLEQKDCVANSHQSIEVANKMKDLTKQIDEYILTILRTIPELKRKGLEAREKCIEEDLRLDKEPGHSSRVEPTLEDETEALDSFAAFMPRQEIDVPQAPEQEPETESIPMDQERTETDQEKRDTFLDGVDPEDVEIMEKLRYLAGVESKENILQALKRLRKREERTDMLKFLKGLEQPKAKTKPMNQDA